MAATDQQIVDALRDAILKLSTGVVTAYTVEGVSYTYADLHKLEAALTRFERRLAGTAANSTGRAIPLDIRESRT